MTNVKVFKKYICSVGQTSRSKSLGKKNYGMMWKVMSHGIQCKIWNPCLSWFIGYDQR